MLNNRYELLQPLGQGGMAKVYLAKDRFLGRRVAVKILHPSLSDDHRFLARFRREAEAAAALNHPHIVSVYDVGNDDNLHYIVMEYVEGLNLKELIVQNGALSPRRAVDIAWQVANALQYAHEHGLVHRDIKPHNIIVAPSGIVKVTDFGIAKVTTEATLTEETVTLGTAQYLSPEQAQNGPVTPRTDIYQLGVVLYEAVTGFVPFPGENPIAVALAHVKEEPVRPTLLHTDVSQDLENIILKAMAKNPKDRFASAEEMAQALQRWESRSLPTSTGYDISTNRGISSIRDSKSYSSTAKVSGSSGCITKLVGIITIGVILSAIPIAVLLYNSNDRASQTPAIEEKPIVVTATPTSNGSSQNTTLRPANR